MKAVLVLLALLPTVAGAELPPPVQRVIELRDVPQDALGIYVVDVESGDVVLDWMGDEPRNPASTMKLTTTLVALDVLGPAYRWRTEVFVRGEIEDGVLDGDLLLKGYGDPFLVTERVWQLVRDIRRAGVHHIDGNLLIDDSWFDVGEYDPAAFDRQPLRAYNVAPNALLMNFKAVRYWFRPNGAGDGVDVQLDPPIDGLSVDNRLGIRKGSCRGFQRGIAITMNDAFDETVLSGRFPSGCKVYAMDRTALSHNAFVHGLFTALWRESGGRFDGHWKNVVVADDEEPLLSFHSLPLHDVISRVNKHSNNVMARQVLYTLSAETDGAPGTEEGGRAVISAWLEARGLDSSQTAVANGAGLSRQTRITPSAMASFLAYAWRQPYMPEYLSSMALSGLDGTLRKRFDFAGLTGQAHLKTGSLDDVSAIAGYLQSRSGRRFAAVSMLNHKGAHRGPGDEVHEALLRWLYED